MSTPKRQSQGPTRRGPGRPSQGIRSEYTRVEVYLPTDVFEGLDRLTSQRQHQAGKTTYRADIIREALAAYLRQHLPQAGC
jgi:hypothetical protein